MPTSSLDLSGWVDRLNDPSSPIAQDAGSAEDFASFVSNGTIPNATKAYVVPGRVNNLDPWRTDGTESTDHDIRSEIHCYILAPAAHRVMQGAFKALQDWVDSRWIDYRFDGTISVAKFLRNEGIVYKEGYVIIHSVYGCNHKIRS